MTELSFRRANLSLIVDRAHYEHLVLGALSKAKFALWIATANLKDLHVEAPLGSAARARGGYVSITERLASLVREGVEVRLLHGGAPSKSFQASRGAKAILRGPKFEVKQCPRVHLKLMAVDASKLYIGSANFTGAGLGAKGDGKRNFEMGILTDDDVLLDAAQSRFDAIWSGRECAGCRLRSVCPAPLDGQGKVTGGKAGGGAARGSRKKDATEPRKREARGRARVAVPEMVLVPRKPGRGKATKATPGTKSVTGTKATKATPGTKSVTGTKATKATPGTKAVTGTKAAKEPRARKGAAEPKVSTR
jgi:hypothetical protein